MGCFAVIDTETTFLDELMSLGVVVAKKGSFVPVSFRYYIITPAYLSGGMFADALYLPDSSLNVVCTREEAIRDLTSWLRSFGVDDLYAYNASFDKRVLSELTAFNWHDIMHLAANRKHNRMIPASVDCHGTGRMKRGYGVEPMFQMLNRSAGYIEEHNALADAFDELRIMELLGLPLTRYERL